MIETSRRWSPYVYALNNPIYFIDPDGMEANTFFKSKFMNESGGHWSDGYKNDDDAESKENKNVYKDEPPVNLFTSTKEDSKQKPFNDVFNEANKNGNYDEGDGFFNVYGHGGIGYINNHNNRWNSPYAESAREFDDMMKALSPGYRKYAKNVSLSFVLIINSCNSATGQGSEYKSLAQQVSKLHPNATIIGFDGFLHFGREKNGTPSITGVSTKLKKVNGIERGDLKGSVVIYKGGEEIKRMGFSEYKKRYKK